MREQRAGISPEEFVNEVVQAHRDGYGFVPFFGAGTSVSAGVPIVREITPYLRKCLMRATGLSYIDWASWSEQLNDASNKEERRKVAVKFNREHKNLAQQVWNPRTDNWPPFTDSNKTDFDTIKRVFRWIIDELGAARDLDSSVEPFLLYGNYESFWDEVIGAASEWRTTLLFLSRLVLTASYRGHKHVLGIKEGDDATFAFTTPNRDVIDTFTSHLISGKTPAREHRLFAYMSDILRIRISLTTNFDDLYERAFYDAGKSITVFDVHQDAGMPPVSIVLLDPRTLIKMHGGKYGFRADYTLEATPSLEDQRRFVSYLLGRPLSDTEWISQKPLIDSKAHLFVVGLGGKDARTQQLMASALHRLPNLHIFWVCHSDNDLGFVSRFFDQTIEDYAKRVHITQYVDVGLLLLELYQSITESVPRGGVEFPAVWRMPLPPEAFPPNDGLRNQEFHAGDADPQNEESSNGSTVDETDESPTKAIQVSTGIAQKAYDGYVEQVVDTILSPNCLWESADGSPDDGSKNSNEEVAKPKPIHSNKLVVLKTRFDSGADCVSVGSDCFQSLFNQRKKCAWLDLDEIWEVDELRERLLETLALKSGVNHSLPVRTDENANGMKFEKFAKELEYVSAGTAEEYVVFINACELFVADSGTAGCIYTSGMKLPDLAELICAVASPCSPQMAVVLLTFDDVEFLREIRSKWKECQDLCIDEAQKQSETPPCICLPSEIEINYHVLHNPIEGARSQSENSDTANSDFETKLIVHSPNSPHVTELKEMILQHQHPGIAGVGLSKEQVLKFLITFTAFHRPRYPVSLTLWSALGGLDQFDSQIGEMQRTIRRDRWKVVSDLLRFLGSKKIIRRKTGGIIWMHHGVRDHLFDWAVKEHQVLVKDLVGQLNQGEAEEKSDAEYLTLPVLDAHQAIADWYGKLFFASQDPVALFESVEHRLKSTLHYFYGAEPKDFIVNDQSELKAIKLLRKSDWPKDKRCRHLSSILEATSLIGQAKMLIRSSGHTTGSSLWLDRFIKILKHLVKKLESDLKRVKPINAEIRSTLTAVRLLLQECEKTRFRIALDVGEPEKPEFNFNYPQQTELPNRDQIAKILEKTSALRVKIYRATSKRRLPECFKNINQMVSLIASANPATEQGEAIEKFWEEMRSQADFSILRARQYGGDFAKSLINNQIPMSSSTGQLLRRTAWCCRHGMYVDLLEAEAMRACNRVNISAPEFLEFKRVKKEWQNRLDRAILTYHFGSEVTRWYPTDDSRTVNTERARLKAFLAIALSERGNYSESRRRLSEAFGLIDERLGYRDDFWNSVLNICHAEASLTQCRDATPGFANLRKSLNTYFFENAELIGLEARRPHRKKATAQSGQDDQAAVENSTENRTNICYPPEVREIQRACLSDDEKRKAIALINDATTILSQDGQLPVSGRQNVWWLQRYWLVKLKSFEYRHFASLDAENSYLKVFSSKEAPTDSLTEADLILRDLIRVNRGDAFLLSRAIHSYLASVAALFFIWRTTSDEPQRQGAILKRLSMCTKCLKTAWLTLHQNLLSQVEDSEADQSGEKQYKRPDSWCFAYARWVHQHTKKTLDRIGNVEDDHIEYPEKLDAEMMKIAAFPKVAS